MTFLYILIGILIFGFLIFIHEFGHFLVAKLCGVRVNEFSINMGPKLFGWKKGETQYSFRLIPIGGYCAMEGEEGDSEDPRSFTAAAWWKRLLILCAGAFMNLVTGFVVVALLYGFIYPMDTSELTWLDPGSALVEQGLQVGDTIYSIDGKRVYNQSDLTLLDGRFDPQDTELVIVRAGKKISYPHFRMERRELINFNGEKQMMYGLSMLGSYLEPSFLNVNKYAVWQCQDFTRMVWYGLQDLVTGRVGLQEMGGPVQAVDVMVQGGKASTSFKEGAAFALYVGALLAINLAVVNMLPIPALDGGRVFFLLITTAFTAITKKKIDPKYEAWIHGVTMILLLILMGVIFVKDVVTIVRR